MLPGGTIQEVTQLNIESLWSGGPFQDPVRVIARDPFQSMKSLGPNALTLSHSRTMGELICLPTRPEWLSICRAFATLFFPVLQGQLTVCPQFLSSVAPVILQLRHRHHHDPRRRIW